MLTAKMISSALVASCLAPLALAASLPRSKQTWSASSFSSLITFGDSYTDENNLNYIGSHNGAYPPVGSFLPESFGASDGGRIWDRYVIQYTGATIAGVWTPAMTLYDYAVSGAVCSNLITPRTFNANFSNYGNSPLFPSVLENEIPAFLADKAAGVDRINTTTPYFSPALTAQDAVYAMWIGTNDLGVYAFLTDSQVAGKTITDYTDCVYEALDKIYASGARYFVIMNAAPLNLAPLYANDTLNGVGDNHYWPDKPTNHTQIAETMHEYVTTVNNVYKYQTPYEILLAGRYPGANFALFDVWQLISDIYDNPSQYLNGTAPPNVEGFEHHCTVNGSYCITEPSPDSYLWYDELHPSEQTDRIIAKNFVDVLNGDSSYATYYSSPQGPGW